MYWLWDLIFYAALNEAYTRLREVDSETDVMRKNLYTL